MMPGMDQCLFCRIVRGDIPASLVFQDNDLIAFRDINPQAPLHVLVVPREHIATTNDLSDEHDALLGKLLRRAAAIAGDHGYAERGYRIVINCNREAGQTVFHLHVHLLAGRGFGWPPG
jgi:histidine triad (HIT) family protein